MLTIRRRCVWAQHDALLAHYHDCEWGRPLSDDHAHFERITLEVFQAGLSWRTILHKRTAFRRAFAGFEPAIVAGWGVAEIDRLLADASIIRNRAKIEATLHNAAAFLQLVEQHGSFHEYIYALPADPVAVHRELRKHFRFFGPTTAESYLQAIGRVPVPHEATCWYVDGNGYLPGAPVPCQETWSEPLLAHVQAVLFDAGDVLLHRWALKPERLRHLHEVSGLVLPHDPALIKRAAEETERFFQRRQHHPDYGSERFWMESTLLGLRALGALGDLEAQARQLLASVRKLPAPEVVDPDAPAVLEALRARGFKLGVVSNWDGTLEAELTRAGLHSYFDVVLDSAVVGVAKPDPRIFDLAVAALRVPRRAILHVGDSWGADVLGAQAAGLRAVLLDALDCEERPCRKIGQLGDLLEGLG